MGISMHCIQVHALYWRMCVKVVKQTWVERCTKYMATGVQTRLVVVQ